MAKRKRSKFLYWLNLNFGIPLAYFLMWLNRMTWRVEVEGFEPVPGNVPYIIAIWHGDLLTGTARIKRHLPMDITISRSRDGELVARFIRFDRAGAIRGSSSRGQTGALRGMARSIEKGHNVCIAVDGPRGPATVVKPGVILIASQTQTPILPAAILAQNAWYFGSWDAAFVPKPFTVIRFVLGEIFTPPPNASREELENARAGLQSTLIALHLKTSK